MQKQDIYLEILRISLPVIRNILSKRIVIGKDRYEAYELSELIHNFHLLFLEEKFGEQDFWFLNNHARLFHERASTIYNYEKIVGLLKELFKIVPEELKNELEWRGPD